MPNVIGWLVENKVILVTLSGGYDAEELKAGVIQVVSMLTQTPPPCHLIIDASAITGFPPNFAEPIGELRKHQIENNGWTILIATNPMMRFFGTIAAKVTNERFRPVATMEAAKTFLHYIDVHLFTAAAPEPKSTPIE